MFDILVQTTKNKRVSLEVSDDGRNIAIFLTPSNEDSEKIAEFSIIDVWDMLKNNLSIVGVGPSTPELFRRKGEALAANMFTIKSYMIKE